MIANLLGGFVSILVGVSLVGPVASEVNNSTHGVIYNATNASVIDSPATALYETSGWGATVLRLVPGFFALGILGVGIAVTYSSLRSAGIV